MEKKKKQMELVRFDWAMKYLLRSQANFVVLEGFLSAVLNEKITIKSILESESNRKRENEKYNRVDIKCENSKGHIIIIEVQNTSEADYMLRLLFGISQVVVGHIDKGHPYQEIPKVYSISIVYFPMGDGSDYVYRGRYEFRGLHTGKPLALTERDRQLFGVEDPADTLPETYFLMVGDFDKVAKTPLDEWMSYLKTGFVDSDTQVPGLLEAKDRLDLLKMTREEYDRYMRDLSDAASFINTQKRKEELAREEGKKEGKKEGKEEGKEEAKLKIAREMKSNLIPIDVISKCTGLTSDQITEL
ncbi:MAG: Rpn family recombination-promoting nuclease/putative transposase [Bacteroidales bacterium]|nr:Rpn family recombination-promoting nuclease/putative transposase [Bacteroidales bacterium]